MMDAYDPRHLGDRGKMIIKSLRAWTREMAQQLRVYAVLLEDQSLLPSTQIRCLTTAYNSD